MLVTLAFFIAGSALGAADISRWNAAPSWGTISLAERFGPLAGLAISFGIIGAIVALSVLLERRRYGCLEGARASVTPWHARLVRGRWPLVWGAIGLALVNVATLIVAGRPWGVTSALALWGSKMAGAVGVDVGAWSYWTAPGRPAQLHASVFTDVTSVMNFGIMLGAFGAAGLAGRLTPSWRVPLPSLAAALVGGLLLGYGARVASGCNIGAYFSGVASTSLHGWLWMAAGLAGNFVGGYLRPLFKLSR